MSIDRALADSELLYLSSLASVLLKRDLYITPVSVFRHQLDCDVGNVVFAEEGDKVVIDRSNVVFVDDFTAAALEFVFESRQCVLSDILKLASRLRESILLFVVSGVIGSISDLFRRFKVSFTRAESIPFAGLEFDSIVPDATFDSLIHRQFVRNDVGSICHKKQIYWDLSESLPEKCAMSVLWNLGGGQFLSY